ncbi:MAG TPA: hypothetical protein VM223_29055, partial [Planctomycetota bacterium]|nr:hypothetical protein [Planctomycetota bacterium]
LDALDEAEAESDESDALRMSMADILTATANVLKGEPPPGHQHSWHDLAAVAEARIRELEKEIEHHSQTWQVRRIEDLESEIRDLRSAHRQRIPR